MAQYSGTAGSVVVGTVTAGEIAEWSLDMSMSPVDVTAFGDNWEEAIPSIRAATGSFSGNADATDGGQTLLDAAMLDGTTVGLALYVNATNYWSIGTALLTGRTAGMAQTGKGDVSYNFKVSGPVSFT